MKNNENQSISNLTDEQISQMYKEYENMGFSFNEVPEEIVEPKPETSQEEKDKPKFVFTFEQFEDEEENFELPEIYKRMKKVLIENSKPMSRARFYIKSEDENGLPFGNFNGAGNRAITMYQPDHPEAGTGRNYGKMFYRWTNPKVMGLMDAIFEECGWDKNELMEE